MKLKDSEIEVLSAVLFDADLPLAVLARDNKIHPTTARSILQRLVEAKILRYYPFINMYPLGYVPYQVYLTPAPAKQAEIAAYLRAHHAVSWFVRLSGSYEYCAAILCRSPFEFTDIMHEMGACLGATFLVRSTTLQTHLSLVAPKFLMGRNARDQFVSWKASTRVPLTLDDTDHRILAGLIQYRYESGRDLSRQLCIPSSTFAQRVKALSAAGVIERFLYIPNWDALGVSSYKILISSRTTHPGFREELWKLARLDPYTYTFTECIGPWDYEVDLRAPTAEAPARFVKELTTHFKKLLGPVEVLRYEERLKLACYPFQLEARGAAPLDDVA